jgi:hypothetical protein
MRETNYSIENEREVFRALHEGQKKYTYFLLAVAGAAITVVINQTQNATLKISQIPLVIGVLLWGLSFFFGCRYLAYVNANLYANLALFRVKRGEHPDLENSNPMTIEAAIKGIKEAMEENSNRANHFFHLQFNFLVGGAILYIIWHILEMYLRGLS